MDMNEAVRKELSLRKDDMLVSGRDVLQDVTRTLMENDWEKIEADLKRAIR